MGLLLMRWPLLESLLILNLVLFYANSFSTSLQLSCREEERSALLQFKRSFVIEKSTCQRKDDYPKASSWDSEGESHNCCSWDGVECDEESGHVIGLDLSGGCIYGSIDSNSTLSHLVHLRKLNLAYNNFNHSLIPTSIGKLSEMTYLNLSSSFFFGQIPCEIQNLTQLIYFDISNNKISGTIPSWLGNITQLNVIHLSFNQFHGSIPQSLYKLNNLESFHVYVNNLNGTVEFDIFLQMRNIAALTLGKNKLTVVFGGRNTNATTLPKFKALSLASCNISEFPDFLRYQYELFWLDLASNSIHGQIPKWIWNSSVQVLDLSSNMLQGQLLIPPSSVEHLDVSNNMLNGEIPALICNLSSIKILDLSNNNFSGTIPRCLGNSSSSLLALNLRNNSFHGVVWPIEFEKGSNLRMIDFSHNRFEGKLPRSLATCMMLEYVDFSNNQLIDVFPTWLGTLSHLKVLLIQKNGFHGVIKRAKNTLEFPNLHIINLSYNSFKDALPSDFIFIWNGIKAFEISDSTYMNAGEPVKVNQMYYFLYYDFATTIMIKSVETYYGKIRDELAVIDLSSNKFSGEIPEFNGNLMALHSLNLSNNMLAGRIPLSVGNLSQLESLDLSQNMLSGEIPQQLTRLNFLQSLNFSHNNLTGRLPQGNQLRTFDTSAFEGNPGLCGDPLPKQCEESMALPLPNSVGEEDDNSGSSIELDWKFVLAGAISGFVVGVALSNMVNTKRQGYWFFGVYRRSPSRIEVTQLGN